MTTTTHVRYALDAKSSQFFVHAFATGLIAVAALNPKFAIRDFSGDAKFAPESLGDASLRIKIKAPSLEIMDDVSPEDRQKVQQCMMFEVLESVRYPDITFVSTEVTTRKVNEGLFKASITGNLTLHGVTRVQKLDAQVMVGSDSLRGYGDFTVRQTDFGIQIASVAGGTLKMKDELKISFFINGAKQE